MPRFLILFVALFAGLALTACADRLDTAGYSTSKKPLRDYNYAAADALMSRAGRAITKQTPMLVSTIGNVNNVESSSTLGRTITEQIAAHLAERGYKVAEMKLRQGIGIQQGGLSNQYSGEFLLSRNTAMISGEHKAAAAVTGTYAVGAQSVLVNLHLIDIRSGSVITGYDYTLPITSDIAAMTNNGQGVKSSFFTMGGL